MSYPIIIKKEITDFLEVQGAKKIYTGLSDDITSPNRVEVWLKSDIFITIEVQIKSDVVTQIMLYYAGDEEVQDFYLHDGRRAFLGTFYADVRSMKEVSASKFPAALWKQYCKVFVAKESYGKELVDAKNLLMILKDLKMELRERFQDVEEMLNSMINSNVNSEVVFKLGDVLEDESQHLYRFLGDKDAVGNYLLLDNDSNSRYMDYNSFKGWKKVDVLPVLGEILERFYIFFDSEYICKILEPVMAELGWSATDSKTIHYNCEPFEQCVKQKKNDDCGKGCYRIKV